MKKYIIGGLFSLAILFGLSFFGNTVEAYTSVKGYYRSNGTYVQPYVRSSPNALKYDNYNYSGSGSLYNKSYYSPSKGYSSSWYTPSYYTDSSYYSGKSLYNYNSYTSPSYSYPSYKSSYNSYFGW
jgi:hypothetical protein